VELREISGRERRPRGRSFRPPNHARRRRPAPRHRGRARGLTRGRLLLRPGAAMCGRR
jgi:hypothetical protein